MIDEHKLAAIKEILEQLHHPETGIWALEDGIMQELTKDEIGKLGKIGHSKKYIEMYIMKKIQEFEKNGTPLNFTEFKSDIVTEIRHGLLANPEEYISTHKLDEYDDIRFQLNAMPHVFMKYRFFASCANAAAAFADVNTKIPPEDIMFLNSTRWDHWNDGMMGHVVPCVRLFDGSWMMVEPQANPRKNSPFIQLIRKKDFQPGKPIEHLLSGMRGQPHIITKITETNYSNHQQFMTQASRVPADKAREYRSGLDDILIGRGAMSSVYISPLEPDVVIKKSNTKDGGRYLDQQRVGYSVVERIKNSGYDVGVTLPTLIDITDKDGMAIIKEQRMKGVTFDGDGNLWASLDEHKKQHISRQMATFLVAMHSTGDITPADKSIKTMFDQSKIHSATDIINAFDGAMPKTLADKLSKAEQYLESTDISDEFHVLTHGDLRVNNLMYDPENGNLSVIDFEMAKHDNVYRDFVAIASASAMPWDCTRRVITEYNAIQKKRYPLKINPEKVQNMLLYAVMHEFARNVTPEQNKKMSDADKQHGFEQIITKINRVTGLDIATDHTQIFEKGRNRLAAKPHAQHDATNTHDNI